MKAPRSVSKSKYLSGLQCSKLLWCHYHRKKLFPQTDESTQAIFDQGHEVGSHAKRLFPNGIEIGRDHWDYDGILKESTALLAQRKPLFEAGFLHAGGFARVDILDPVGKDRWDIVEVKSATKVKDVNLDDIAFQRFVYEGAGIKVRRACLLVINNQYVRRGEVDPRQLLKREDVTDEVSARLPGVRKNLAAMQATLRGADEPSVGIGPHCSAPYECPLMGVCWKHVPKHSIFTLRDGRKAWDWYAAGHRAIRDLPEDVELNGKQQIQARAIRSRKAHVDPAALRAFLRSLRFPLHFLDFETMGPAIPLFDEARPYRAVPFQFSLHVVEAEGAKPVHHSFLAEGRGDPRPAFLKKLSAHLGTKGSIVAFNAVFETGVLKQACEAFPRFEPWRQKIEKRVVDLLVPFRDFSYYHPDQEGSASMKAVLPALTGRGYEKLEIQEGTIASMRFLDMTYGDLPEAERQKIRADLEAYCGLDTLGMVWIVDKLRELAK